MPLVFMAKARPDVDIFDREEKNGVSRAITSADAVAVFPGPEDWCLEPSLRRCRGLCGRTPAQRPPRSPPNHRADQSQRHVPGRAAAPLYCLPVANGMWHRLALRLGRHLGNPKFFSAPIQPPHPAVQGIRPVAAPALQCPPLSLESYAQVFEQKGALDRLEAFRSRVAPRSPA